MACKESKYLVTPCSYQLQNGIDVTAAAQSSGFLSNSPFKIDSGSFEVISEIVDGKVSKVVECVTPGKIYIPTSYFKQSPTDSSYGTYTVWLYQGSASNTLFFQFINSVLGGLTTPGQDGYTVRLRTDLSIHFTKSTSGSSATVNRTAAGYFNTQQWYKLDIQRKTSGEFTTFLDDELIVVTTGTNPIVDGSHTLSNLSIFDMDAGDKVLLSAYDGSNALTYSVKTQ